MNLSRIRRWLGKYCDGYGMAMIKQRCTEFAWWRLSGCFVLAKGPCRISGDSSRQGLSKLCEGISRLHVEGVSELIIGYGEN